MDKSIIYNVNDKKIDWNMPPISQFYLHFEDEIIVDLKHPGF